MKIVIFDTWRVGLNFTDNVAKKLHNDGHELIFAHTEKFQLNYLPKDRADFCKETYLQRSHNDKYYNEIIDISNRFNISAYSALKKLRPDVLIFISFNGFAQKWFNYVGRLLGVPTLAYMHGVINEKVMDNRNRFKGKLLSKLPRVFSYFLQFIHYTKDSYKAGSKLPISVFFNEFKELITNFSKYRMSPTYGHNLNFNTICVVHKHYINTIKELFPIDEQIKFVVSGHDDFDKIMHHESFESHYKNKQNTVKKVVFLSQPITRDLNIPMKDVLFVLRTLKQLCQELNYQFIVRPHPRDDDQLISILRRESFLISGQDLGSDLLEADAIVGMNSTSLLTADALNIPLVIVEFYNCDGPGYLKSSNNAIFIGSKEMESKRLSTFLQSSIDHEKSKPEFLIPSDIISREVNILNR